MKKNKAPLSMFHYLMQFAYSAFVIGLLVYSHTNYFLPEFTVYLLVVFIIIIVVSSISDEENE